ncbi:MAG: hypothetical protein ACRDUV_17160 [Pseudonocardiaceae bacterium]
MTHDPPVTRAPAVVANQHASVPTRARRWGEVPPEERRELRVRLGTRLWTERASAGMTQRQLAERAGSRNPLCADWRLAGSGPVTRPAASSPGRCAPTLMR